MPIDSHSYLAKRGWAGKGKGLREGSIARPIVASQKKDLAGLGKNRDEGFAFWDHIYDVAASTIQIKVPGIDSDNGAEAARSEGHPRLPQMNELQRTSTGILSNRRPNDGRSDRNNVVAVEEVANEPRLSLLAMAQREAAKRELYSRFFRGQTLQSEYEELEVEEGKTGSGGTEVDKTTLEEVDRNESVPARKRKRSRGGTECQWVAAGAGESGGGNKVEVSSKGDAEIGRKTKKKRRKDQKLELCG